MNLVNLLRGTVVAAALALAGQAAADTYRLGHHHAVGGTVDQLANKFAELVKAKTDGRVTVQVFPAAQLGQEREAMDLLNQGAIDMSVTSTGVLDKYYPAIAVTSLPFIFRDWDHAMGAFHGEFGQALTDGVRANSNIEVLSYVGLGFRDMLFRGNPVTKVEGMQGLKMRSPESAVWIRMYELLGAKPTPVTWGEVYTAMQTGVAAGLDSPAQAALDMKFQEVTKSIVRTAQMFGAMALTMNEDKFAKLSAEDQKLVIEAAREATDWADKTISIPGEQAAYGVMEKSGMTVVPAENPEAWAAAMRPLWDEVAAKAPDADKLIAMLTGAK
jgi:tripartite ATP-independent transporter DctP family solute receptor